MKDGGKLRALYISDAHLARAFGGRLGITVEYAVHSVLTRETGGENSKDPTTEVH